MPAVGGWVGGGGAPIAVTRAMPVVYISIWVCVFFLGGAPVPLLSVIGVGGGGASATTAWWANPRVEARGRRTNAKQAVAG